MRTRPLLSWVVLLLAPSASGHGPLHERIQLLSKQIEQSPQSFDLRLQRGLLHHAHEDWKAALADFDHAADLDPERPEVWFHRGASLLALGEAKEAERSLDLFLTARPEHTEGLLVRAKARGAQADWRAAVADYDLALPNLARPRPGPWLARAAAQRQLTPDGPRLALAGLAEAARALGPLVVFDVLCLELERELRDHVAAVARLDRLIERSRRDERWWFERGVVLEEAGLVEEALASWRRGLEAVEALPQRLRETKAMRDLCRELRDRIGGADLPKTAA